MLNKTIANFNVKAAYEDKTQAYENKILKHLFNTKCNVIKYYCIFSDHVAYSTAHSYHTQVTVITKLSGRHAELN